MSDTTGQSEPTARRGLRKTAARAGVVAFAALRVVRAFRALVRTALEILLALIIIFEEWGWRPLAALLARLARLKPVAALEAGIASLPPYPSLLVFALPSALLFPLKLLSLWLIAEGRLVLASLLFAGAKIAGTALLARIYQLTEPRLMQLSWFSRLHGIVIPWKDALVARVKATPMWIVAAALKARAKSALKSLLDPLKPAVAAMLQRLRGLLRRG